MNIEPGVEVPAIEISVIRAQNKLLRFSNEYSAYAEFQGSDVEEIVHDILELKDITKEKFFDLGLLLHLKTLRLRLKALKLLSDIEDMALIEQTEATIEEIEEFYRDLEHDKKNNLENLRNRTDHNGESLIPNLPPAMKEAGFDISCVDNPKLFQTIVSFFNQERNDAASMDIPEELLALTKPIDMAKLKEEIISAVNEAACTKSTVRQISKRFKQDKSFGFFRV